MTGRLYLSTNCAKAPLSPCLTRNIKAASGSSSADIMNQFNRHPDGDKVMGKRKIPRVVTGNQAPKPGESHCPFNRSSDRLCRSAGEPREAYGMRPACWRFRATHRAQSGSKLQALHALRDIRLRLCGLCRAMAVSAFLERFTPPAAAAGAGKQL